MHPKLICAVQGVHTSSNFRSQMCPVSSVPQITSDVGELSYRYTDLLQERGISSSLQYALSVGAKIGHIADIYVEDIAILAWVWWYPSRC